MQEESIQTCTRQLQILPDQLKAREEADTLQTRCESIGQKQREAQERYHTLSERLNARLTEREQLQKRLLELREVPEQYAAVGRGSRGGCRQSAAAVGRMYEADGRTIPSTKKVSKSGRSVSQGARGIGGCGESVAAFSGRNYGWAGLSRWRTLPCLRFQRASGQGTLYGRRTAG